MSALTFCYAVVPGVCRRTGQRVLSTLAGETSGFHIVAHEFGHSGRPLPTWTCSRPGNVKFDDDAMVVTTHRDLSLFVPGCFQLLNVLTPGECDQLTNITTCMGWDEDAPVSLPYSFRHMENVNWLADDSVVNRIWGRAVRALPDFAAEVAPGAESVGLNARFRCYRYRGGDYFKPHTDGSWPGSGVSHDRKKLIWDRWPGERWSQYTFLLLLTEGYKGGRTVFYPQFDSKKNGDSKQEWLDFISGYIREMRLDDIVSVSPTDDHEGSLAVKVRTPKGAALCFPHGGHPLHAKHAGERVQLESGEKIMVRTEILYNRTSEADTLQTEWFRSGSGQVNK